MRQIVYVLLLSLALAAPARAQTEPVGAFSGTTAASTETAARKMLDIRAVKSPGGITAWLVEDHTLPIISIEFSFKDAGSARESKENQGLARLVSNTLDEGAGDYDAQAFQKALSDHSISLSFGAGRDDFSGSLKMLTRHKDKALELMALALSQPRFEQEAIDRMKAANIARIKSSMTEPDWIAARLQNDRAYGDHPYALNSGGTLSTLAALTREDLQNFVKNNLTRDRLHIGVAGDISADELGRALDQLFAGLPEKAAASEIKDTPIQNIGKTYLYRQDIPQSFISLVGEGIDYRDPDYYPALVMNFVLGGSGFGSRLTEEVREKRGLTYGINSYLFDMDHASGFSIGLSTENKNAAEALKIIHAEMGRMRDQGITDAELKTAQDYLVGSLPMSFSSTAAIAGALRALQEVGYPMDHYDRYPALIRGITRADIERVSRRLLHPEKMLTILVGQPAGISATDTVTALPNVE